MRIAVEDGYVVRNQYAIPNRDVLRRPDMGVGADIAVRAKANPPAVSKRQQLAPDVDIRPVTLTAHARSSGQSAAESDFQ
jgi:hypothetical protein